MKLEYIGGTNIFVLRVRRGEADVGALMREHGLDFATAASTVDEAILMTHEPYAACAFAEFGDAGVRAKLAPLLKEIEASWAKASAAHIACPGDRELWDFQRAGVEYAMRRNNTLIADQPGLGKTPTAICIANEMKAKRILVIGPANIRLQWARRIREWSTMKWPFTVYPILTAGRGVHPTAEWTIVSYDLARTEAIWRALARSTYDLLIVDEAHYLKSPDSKRTRCVFGAPQLELPVPALQSRCGMTIALTGTPTPNRPREAYTLARALCWDAIDWMAEESFGRRFNPVHVHEYTDQRTGRTVMRTEERAGRAGELQSRLRSNFMVRRLKRDVMTQLKLPRYDVVLVEDTAAIRAAVRAESLLGIDPDNPDAFANRDAKIIGDMSVVRHQMGVAIAPQAAEYAALLLDGGLDKICLMGWHHDALDIVQRELQKYGVIRVDGRVSQAQKQARVDEFIKDPKKRVFLGNVQAAGTGTDGLQAVCQRMVLFEPSWVDGENQQVIDRLDRGGQEGQVQADFLVAVGSVGERILSRALTKGQEVHKALDRKVTITA